MKLRWTDSKNTLLDEAISGILFKAITKLKKQGKLPCTKATLCKEIGIASSTIYEKRWKKHMRQWNKMGIFA